MRLLFVALFAACLAALLVASLRRVRLALKYLLSLIRDPFGLAYYSRANHALGPPAPGELRVVFLGDSILQLWDLPGSFPGRPWINRGISGQTTPQMLLRFHQDVITLSPAAVVIQGGINDIGGKFGRPTLTQTEDNLAAMAEMAAANHIRVVFCSVLPNGFDRSRRWKSRAGKIIDLNHWIEAYATRNGHSFVDFYSAMKDKGGGMPAALSGDGVHPLPAGFAILAPLVEAGIAKALADNR